MPSIPIGSHSGSRAWKSSGTTLPNLCLRRDGSDHPIPNRAIAAFSPRYPAGGGKPNFPDRYYPVVGKTLDGLFLMLGEEEKKIRKDPAAQTTSLLKDVFGRK